MTGDRLGSSRSQAEPGNEIKSLIVRRNALSDRAEEVAQGFKVGIGVGEQQRVVIAPGKDEQPFLRTRCPVIQALGMAHIDQTVVARVHDQQRPPIALQLGPVTLKWTLQGKLQGRSE